MALCNTNTRSENAFICSKPIQSLYQYSSMSFESERAVCSVEAKGVQDAIEAHGVEDERSSAVKAHAERKKIESIWWLGR